MFDDHHGERATLLLDQLAVLDTRIAQLGTRIEQAVEAIPAAWGINADGTAGLGARTGPDALVLPAVARLAEISGVSLNLARTRTRTDQQAPKPPDRPQNTRPTSADGTKPPPAAAVCPDQVPLSG